MSDYPGKCPSCGLPAYVGVVPADVKCSSLGDCPHRERKATSLEFEAAKAYMDSAIAGAWAKAARYTWGTFPSVTVPPSVPQPSYLCDPDFDDDDDDDDGDADP